MSLVSGPVWGRAAALLEQSDRTRNYREHPVDWATDRAGLFLWSKQREIFEAVRDHPRVTVRACHSAGKSLTAGAVTCWWIDTHPIGTAMVITTAPTGAQVKAILWKEINRVHSRAGLTGRTNLTEWYIGKELVAFGRKPADHNPDAFQGLHALYILVIIDEGSGVPKEIFDAASTLASNQGAKLLVIGNPDNPHGEFAESHKPDSGWHTIKIGYRDTPNFTGESVPQLVRDSLISMDWVQNRRERWGSHSALFTSKCEGEFPVDAENGVVPHSWATACRTADLAPTRHSIRDAGVDVGAGGDRTIIRERVGRRAGREDVFIDPDPMRTVGRLVQRIREWGITRVKVDSNGIGWGVYGRLREMSTRHHPEVAEQAGAHGAEVVAVNTAEAASNPVRFLNLRAEIYWEVGRELSRLQQWDLAEVDDDTIHELTAATYEIIDSTGKIKVERKKDIISRLGVSPDHSDALLLAFYEPLTAARLPDQTTVQQMGVDLTSGLAPGSWGS